MVHTAAASAEAANHFFFFFFFFFFVFVFFKKKFFCFCLTNSCCSSEKAAQDPAYALKGFAQMGLSLKKSGKQEEAVAAFRRALQVPSTSSKEQVQILYLLGRTLESLGRIPEVLETYRWLRREAPQYRDVTMRIESLSMRRMHRDNRQGEGDSPWAKQALQMWQGILRNGK